MSSYFRSILNLALLFEVQPHRCTLPYAFEHVVWLFERAESFFGLCMKPDMSYGFCVLMFFVAIQSIHLQV